MSESWHISPVCLDGRLGQKSGGLPTLANGSVVPIPAVLENRGSDPKRLLKFSNVIAYRDSKPSFRCAAGSAELELAVIT